jgi:CelD/BcsL family acetyltransferase involved in cellulose biosynthesis
MVLHVINPLSDRRWDDLVARHERSSAFHQRGWLEALAATYGFQPFALTSSARGEALSDGVVLCRVSSWVTGTRWVSLPFSDHCEPLLRDPSEWFCFEEWLRERSDLERLKYVELRPISEVGTDSNLHPSCSYFFHQLDLQPTLEHIFQGFHKDCIQRKIRRAEKEKVSYEVGQSEELVREFYRLLLITRKRHQLLPQPRLWIRNLIERMGDRIQIRVARKDGIPIAALLTLRHRSSVVYKYGCSDDKFHPLGGMPFLFWRLIEESKASGALNLDLGRSDLDHEGLLHFKDRLGSERRTLTYYRHCRSEKKERKTLKGSISGRRLLAALPDVISSTAGRVLYRHVG